MAPDAAYRLLDNLKAVAFDARETRHSPRFVTKEWLQESLKTGEVQPADRYEFALERPPGHGIDHYPKLRELVKTESGTGFFEMIAALAEFRDWGAMHKLERALNEAWNAFFSGYIQHVQSTG